MHHRVADPARRDGGRLTEWHRILVHVPEHNREGSPLLRERQLAGEQFVQHDPGRVHISGRTQLRTLGLLRRHVRRRTEQFARPRRKRVVLTEHPRDPEVTNLHRAVVADEHVLRLHVTVQHTMSVRAVEARTDHERDRARGALVISLRDKAVPDGASAQALHDENAGVLVFDVVVDGHNVRVIDGRQHLCFDVEALAHRIRGHEIGRKKLDGDFPPELAMARSHDHSERASADLLTYLVSWERGFEGALVLHQTLRKRLLSTDQPMC